MVLVQFDDHRHHLTTPAAEVSYIDSGSQRMNLAVLHQVTEEFAAYLSEVTDGDLTAPTPCAAWTVKDLFDHVLDANAKQAEALDPGTTRPARHGIRALRETIYRDSARRAADALARAVDVSVRPSSAPAGGSSPEDLFEKHLANTLIHTWDLAQAIQIDFDPPNPLALEIALGYVRRLPPECRGSGKPFAKSLNYPAAASMDEVLFLAGRSPSRTMGG
jgi:uncharacterized protein (TIGR03086 family)